MRTAVRCVLAVIATAASVVAGPADASLAATNQSNGFAIGSVLPTQGEVVGVAHPVVVTFRAPIANRHAAERAIDVKSAPAMAGKFEWLDNDVVQWVPDRFWPARSTVALSVGGLSTNFATGPAVVGIANISDHTFTVSIDGVDAGSLPAPHHRPFWGKNGVMPASMGRPEYPTPVGTYTVLAKERSVTMDSSSVGIPVDCSRRLSAQGGLRRPFHQPWPLRAFSSVGGQFNGVRECQPRLHQPEPRGRRVVLQHGQCWRPDHRAGEQHRSSSVGWRFAAAPGGRLVCRSPRVVSTVVTPGERGTQVLMCR